VTVYFTFTVLVVSKIWQNSRKSHANLVGPNFSHLGKIWSLNPIQAGLFGNSPGPGGASPPLFEK